MRETVLNDLGEKLDATFSVEEFDEQLHVILESRSGTRGTPSARNADYGPALALLLTRLKNMGARIADAQVDSTSSRNLPVEERRLVLDRPFPLVITDVEQLRAQLSRAQTRVGQDSSASGGNSTKRLRLMLSFLSGAHQSLAEVRRTLAGTPTANVTTAYSNELDVVNDEAQIRMSQRAFNREAQGFPLRSQNILRQTSFWVFDPVDNVFGPSKFVGFQEMNFARYCAALGGDFTGVRFDGHTTRVAIERALQIDFAEDDELSVELSAWGERLFGSEIFEGIDESKWKFARLPKSANDTLEMVVVEPDELALPTSDRDLLNKKVGLLLARGPISPPAGNRSPVREVRFGSVVTIRLPEVATYVLQMAAGTCELCRKLAPFKTPDGRLYLEVHHVKRLADGGSDTVENAVGLCPNCHRQLHSGTTRAEDLKQLFKQVSRLRSE